MKKNEEACPFCECKEHWFISTKDDAQVFQCTSCLKYYKVSLSKSKETLKMKSGKKVIVNFNNEDKSNMDFRGYDFDKGVLYGTNLSNSNLEGVNLRAANLKYSILINTNLRNANLTGANLHCANLSGADLTGAILNSCNIKGTDFKDAIITGADFQCTCIKKAKNLDIILVNNIKHDG